METGVHWTAWRLVEDREIPVTMLLEDVPPVVMLDTLGGFVTRVSSVFIDCIHPCIALLGLYTTLSCKLYFYEIDVELKISAQTSFHPLKHSYCKKNKTT